MKLQDSWDVAEDKLMKVSHESYFFGVTNAISIAQIPKTEGFHNS